MIITKELKKQLISELTPIAIGLLLGSVRDLEAIQAVLLRLSALIDQELQK